MKTLFPILIVLLSCFVIFSCSKDESNPTQPTNGTIQGQVTNSTGDTVIVGAIVSTSPATGSVSTNAEGNYTISDVPTGQYTVTASKGGYNPASITVTVAGGKTTSANIHLTYPMGNQPPNPATLISPVNGSIDQPTTTVLRWACSDPDGDALTYNIYFGKTTPPTTIISLGQTDTNIVRSGLDTATTYYWKVIAKDHHGDSSISSISSFTTHGDTLGKIEGKVTNATGDTAIVGALVTTNPPTSSVNTNAEGNYLIKYVLPGQYTVMASKGGYNPGSVTVIVTAAQTTTADIHLVRNNPPNSPSFISPSDGATDLPKTITLSWTCSDPDGDPLTYDVYFDKTNPPSQIVSSNQSSTTNIRSALDTATTYYWKVIAKDNRGGSTSSAIWSFTTVRDTIPTLGLVAYYPFNGNANDESGYGNHGVTYGTALTSDRLVNTNSAYSFDGIDDYIEVPHSNILQPTSQLSVCVWVNVRAFSSGPYQASIILKKGGPWAGIGRYEIWHVGNVFRFDLQYADGTDITLVATIQLQLNTWYFLVLTYNGQLQNGYINGNLAVSSNVSKQLGSNNDNLSIGRNSGNVSFPYYENGIIDDLRIYDRALSVSEIQQLYREGGW